MAGGLRSSRSCSQQRATGGDGTGGSNSSTRLREGGACLALGQHRFGPLLGSIEEAQGVLRGAAQGRAGLASGGGMASGEELLLARWLPPLLRLLRLLGATAGEGGT